MKCPDVRRTALPALALALALALAAAVALAAPPAARAGNRSTYFIGGRAAGMAGAFSAFGDDGSAAWYNPAALSVIDRNSFDLSASAYGFEIVDVPAMVRTTLQGRSHDSEYHTSALAIVPTSLDAVFRLTKPGAAVRHVLAFSVLVPQQSNVSQTFEFEEPDAFYRQKFRLADQISRYYVGPSYGVWLNENVSVGGSLFAVYDQVKSSASAYFHQDLTDGVSPLDWFILSQQSVDGMIVGLTASAAVHLRFGGFRLGAQVRAPVLRLYTSADETDINAAVLSPLAFSQAASDFADADRSVSEWGFEPSTPMSIVLGLGWDVPQSWRVGIDVTWHSALALENSVDFRHTVNVAAGAEVWLTDKIPLSFGFFTDFAPLEDIAGFGDRKMNYYGGTVAVSFLSPYKVVESEKTDLITFATTLGVHYAYGFGEAVGMVFDFDAPGGQITFERRAATGHDIHLFVGSTVRY